MGYVTNWMGHWLVKHNAIKPSDRELYEYAIYSFLLSMIPLAIFLIVSGIIGLFQEGILIIFPFMIIRKFSGGYHAKHAYVCLLISTVLLSICLFVATHITIGWILHAVLGVAGISLMINSPIDSENKKLVEGEIKQYKHIIYLVVAIIVMLYAILSVFRMEKYSICIAVSLILSALLQLPCIVGKLLGQKRRTI